MKWISFVVAQMCKIALIYKQQLILNFQMELDVSNVSLLL